MQGFNFEYGHEDNPVFLGVRYCNDWVTSTEVAHGEPYVWYKMEVSVSASPFVITTSVFTENGTCLGSCFYSDMANFGFEDINYIGFGIWGFQPADYLFRNIQEPPNNQNIPCISISADCSSKVGSTVNLYGILTDSNNTPLQNKTVVLSYIFPGITSWIPISSSSTDENGKYNIQWVDK